jgi:hypothetical protein
MTVPVPPPVVVPDNPPAAPPAAPPAPAAPPVVEPPKPAPAAATEPPKAAPAPPAKRTLEDSLAGLDDDTRNYVLDEVTKARQEAASSRTTAKQTAAEEARKEMAQAVGKALGLVTADEPVDPAKLTEQLTVAQQQAKQTKVELAVYQAASTAGADAAKLLDSRSFAATLADLDPTDAAGIQAAITEAVTANPAFAAIPGATPPPLPRPNPALGASGGEAPTLDDQIAIAKKDGNLRLAMHLENQKLLPANSR